MDGILAATNDLMGIDTDDLSIMQMSARAIVVFVVGLALVRIGEKRFLGKSTAFDVLLAIILGSVLSRAINGSAEFIPTLVASLILVLLHWSFAVISYHSDRFGSLIKGSERTLIEDGKVNWDEMRASHLSRNDLLTALRTNAKLTAPDAVRVAYLERSGDISVIPRDHEPKVVEVAVEDGVKTIRIQLNT